MTRRAASISARVMLGRLIAASLAGRFVKSSAGYAHAEEYHEKVRRTARAHSDPGAKPRLDPGRLPGPAGEDHDRVSGRRTARHGVAHRRRKTVSRAGPAVRHRGAPGRWRHAGHCGG